MIFARFIFLPRQVNGMALSSMAVRRMRVEMRTEEVARKNRIEGSWLYYSPGKVTPENNL